MSRLRAINVGVLALAVMVIHLVLLRLMAHGHVAHVLLGSGNALPPIGAALLALSLVVARFVAIVIAPGAVLASLTSLVAHALVGPKKGRDYGEGEGDDPDGGGAGTGTKSGTVIHSEDVGSGEAAVGGGTAINIEGRAM